MIIGEASIDLSGVRTSLAQMDSMVTAAMKNLSAKTATAGAALQGAATFGIRGAANIGTATAGFERMLGVSGRLNQSLDKMTGMFNSGLGIGATVAGMGLLVGGFTKAIEKARQFQTAQLAISAILQSGYKIVTPKGVEATSSEAFLYAQAQSQKYNMQLIERSRKNILTYEEQLQSFQTGLATGARKGLQPDQVMKISEDLAVAAKAIGMRGERIADSVRILLGGGVNVSRSQLARVLGIHTADITQRSGEELTQFLGSRIKGFQSPEVMKSFSQSIEAVITTMTSEFDVFFAKIGGKFMKNITPMIQEMGKALSGSGADQAAETITTLFTSIFKAVEAIAKSPAIPIIMKLIGFLAGAADKIIIGAVILKLVSILGSAGSAALKFIGFLNGIGAAAAESAVAVNGLAAASGRIGGVGVGGKGTAVVGSLAATKAEAALAAKVATKEANVLANAPLMAGAGVAETSAARSVAARKAAKIAATEAKVAAEAEMTAVPLSWSDKNVPNYKSMGQKALGVGKSILSRGMYGAMAGMGIEAVSSMAGTNQGVGADITHGASAAATVGIALSAFPPLAIAASALTALFVGLGSSVKRANEEYAQARSNLETTRTENPQAAKMIDLKIQERQLLQAKRRGTTQNLDELGINQASPGFSLFGMQIGGTSGETKDWMGPGLIKGQLKKNREEQAALAKNFSFETSLNRSQEILGAAQAAAKEAGMGYGSQRDKQQIYYAFAVQAAEIRKSLAEQSIELIDGDLKDRLKVIDSSRSQITQQQKAGKITDAQEQELSKKLRLEEDKLQQEQAHRLIEEARQKKDDTLRTFELQRQQTLSGLDTSIAGRQKTGLIQTEIEMMGKKETLGAEFPAALAKAKKTFTIEFNAPLQKIENDIKNLQFGVGTEHTVDNLKLSFKALTAKIAEAVAKHQISLDQAAKMFAESAAQNQADLKIANWQQAHTQQLGATPVERITNRGQSQLAEAEAQYQATVANRTGRNISGGIYGAIAGIEEQRQTGQFSSARQFEQFKQQQMGMAQNNIQAQMQMWPLEQEQRKQQLLQTQYGAEGARLGAKTYGWNVQTDEEQRTQAGVDAQIREKILTKRRIEGLPTERERVEAGVAQYDLGKKQAESAAKMAEASAKGAEIQEKLTQANEKILGINLDSVMEDYKQAILAATKYLNNMVGNEKTPNTKQGIQTVTNAKGEKVLTNQPQSYNASINIEKTEITQADIDKWIPTIKDALCRLVGQSKSRG